MQQTTWSCVRVECSNQTLPNTSCINQTDLKPTFWHLLYGSNEILHWFLLIWKKTYFLFTVFWYWRKSNILTTNEISDSHFFEILLTEKKLSIFCWNISSKHFVLQTRRWCRHNSPWWRLYFQYILIFINIFCCKSTWNVTKCRRKERERRKAAEKSIQNCKLWIVCSWKSLYVVKKKLLDVRND